jgi:hypothetical protein
MGFGACPYGPKALGGEGVTNEFATLQPLDGDPWAAAMSSCSARHLSS